MYVIGVIGQWAAFCALGLGIAIEIHYGANIGFVGITIGSVLFAGATKVKVLGKEKIVKQVKGLKKEIERLHNDKG